MNCKYTQEHIDFLKDNIIGTSFKDLTEMFNKKFSLDVSMNSVVSLADRNGLHNQRNALLDGEIGKETRFKKGHIPFNKGKKKYWKGGEETQFKKGHKPKNYRLVGSERINVDGYIEIKVADPNKWRLKHQVVWEEAHGPIPKGHAVIFGDSNKLNVDINNLILVTRHQLLELNKNNLIQNNAELTKTAVLVADLNIEVKKRKKKG